MVTYHMALNFFPTALGLVTLQWVLSCLLLDALTTSTCFFLSHQASWLYPLGITTATRYHCLYWVLLLYPLGIATPTRCRWLCQILLLLPWWYSRSYLPSNNATSLDDDLSTGDCCLFLQLPQKSSGTAISARYYCSYYCLTPVLMHWNPWIPKVKKCVWIGLWDLAKQIPEKSNYIWISVNNK